MSHNGVIATTDTIPWSSIDMIYIKPYDSELWVLYDHRLESVMSTGYAECDGPLAGMCNMRPPTEDPFGFE
eukprot:6503632-Heterocapsa_arctica.AAC.1